MSAEDDEVQRRLDALADWLPRGEAWACEAAELLRRAADQIDRLRAELADARARGDGWRAKFNEDTDHIVQQRNELERLRPLAAIGEWVQRNEPVTTGPYHYFETSWEYRDKALAARAVSGETDRLRREAEDPSDFDRMIRARTALLPTAASEELGITPPAVSGEAT